MEWKQIKETKYEISNTGIVRRKYGDIYKYLKNQTSNKGYYRVNVNYETHFIHRLVGFAFVPNPNNKPHINHLDGDKKNNHYNNLEWVTVNENNDHAQKIGLSHAKIPCTAYDADYNIVAKFESSKDMYRNMHKIKKGTTVVIKDCFATPEHIKLTVDSKLRAEKKVRKTYVRVKVIENRSLSEEQVRLIKRLSKEEEYYPAKLGRIFHSDDSVIIGIIKGKLYKDVK